MESSCFGFAGAEAFGVGGFGFGAAGFGGVVGFGGVAGFGFGLLCPAFLIISSFF
jgi:hypothetical protein